MSILKTIPIALDLKRVGAQAQALPTLVEGDNGNVFVITLTDDGEPLDLSTASRVICVFSKTSDGKTVEQDTKDANVFLDDYGIALLEGETATLNDTIKVTNAAGTLSALVTGGITGATVDDEKFLAKFPDDGQYQFVYNGTSWQYGSHSVTISGTDHNIVTVALKSASFGAGTNNCEVQIYSGDDGEILVTSANFNFKGRKGILNEETILSEEKYPILVDLISKVQQALAKAMPYTSVTITAHHVNGLPTVSATITEDSVSWDFGIPNGVHIGTTAPEGDEEVWIDTSNNLLPDNLMTTAVYDTDEDGIVDNSEALNGHADTYFANAASVTAITEIKITSFDSSEYVWDSNTHSSDTDGAFPYRCAIPATGVLATMMAEVVFGTASAMSGLYSPISECGSGVVYIWASEQTAPTVLSILAHK